MINSMPLEIPENTLLKSALLMQRHITTLGDYISSVAKHLLPRTSQPKFQPLQVAKLATWTML